MSIDQKLPLSQLLQELGRSALMLESTAIQEMASRLDHNFEKAIQLILNSPGKVIISGMGKSGLIAQKIAATLSSTGTTAIFMHPAEAAHGDLGMVCKGDVLIGLSKSGTTEELNFILPYLQQQGIPIIAMVGNVRSQLASYSDVYLDTSVSKEACPFDLAPTSSTTAMLAMGDALAIGLMHAKQFSETDFALTHPSGALGRRLTMRLEDVMSAESHVPKVSLNASFAEVMLEMSSKRFGATTVIDDEGKLIGVFTDGDLRRVAQSNQNLQSLTAKELMTPNPKSVKKEMLAKACLEEMETHRITQMIVCDKAHKPIGIVHIHDLVSLGM